MTTYLSLLFLILLTVQVHSYQRPDPHKFVDTLKLWPRPHHIENGTDRIILRNPCRFTVRVRNRHIPEVDQLFEYYKTKMFPHLDCNLYSVDNSKYAHFMGVDGSLDRRTETLYVEIDDTNDTVGYPHFNMTENYTVTVGSDGFHIKAPKYWGFTRAIETFSQLIHSVKVRGTNSSSNHTQDRDRILYYIPNTPITISDYPNFIHRGVMMDSSRHFLSPDTLKRVIEGLAFNKMNVLHWHILDADSFPFWVSKFPNVTLAAAFSKKMIFSPDNVKDIVEFARIRGVRVIPEIESPGHTRSWGESAEFEDIISCRATGGYCAQPPCGQVNPNMEKTYTLLQAMMDEVMTLFHDTVVHFGGDEVNTGCWGTDPRLKGEDGRDLSVKFQSRQRDMISDRKAMYWGDSPYSGKQYDITHMWGGFGGASNHYLVASYAGDFYLDCGLGNLFGGDGTWCEPLKTWHSIYRHTLDMEKNSEWFIGVENTLFGEMNNDATTDNKVWPRAAATGELTWNGWNGTQGLMSGVADRLIAQVKRMVSRGISATPVTTTYCELNLKDCIND